ncbi:MAG: hypothetical protein K2X82_16930 [Gemmataceae bacterium]|nr:hypothetical protein [Gemmataceae bacterium]
MSRRVRLAAYPLEDRTAPAVLAVGLADGSVEVHADGRPDGSSTTNSRMSTRSDAAAYSAGSRSTRGSSRSTSWRNRSNRPSAGEARRQRH